MSLLMSYEIAEFVLLETVPEICAIREGALMGIQGKKASSQFVFAEINSVSNTMIQRKLKLPSRFCLWCCKSNGTIQTFQNGFILNQGMKSQIVKTVKCGG